MNKIKKIVVMLLCFCLMFSFGCSVNTQKYRDQAVAKVGDDKITKGEIDDMAAYALISYYVNYKEEIDIKDESVFTFKKDLLNNMVDAKLLSFEKETYKIVDNKEKATKDAKTEIANIKKTLSDEDLKRIMTVYNIDEERMLSAAISFNLTNLDIESYSKAFMNKEIGSETFSKKVFLETADQKVPSYIYYYYMIQKEFSDNMNGQEELDDKALNQRRDEIIKAIEEKAAFIEQGKKDNIKITEDDIKKNIDTLSYLDNAYGESSIKSFCDAYYITMAQYKEAIRWVATSGAYEDKLLAAALKDVKISDSEAKSYFSKNKNKYNPSTVSAKHILAKDKETAKLVYDAARQKGANFDEIMGAFQNYSGIIEASDLGAFRYSDMVEPFSKAAFSMKIGQIKGPVETNYGFHIIYKYNESKVSMPSFEAYKDIVTADAKKEKEDKIKEDTAKKIASSYKSNILIKDIENPYDMFLKSLKTKYGVKLYENKLK